MKRKNTVLTIVILTLSVLGTYFVLNSRMGVHLSLDVLMSLGEEKKLQTSASDGPLKLSAQLSPVEKIVLPASIEQPSGIKHRNGAVYISTDQTEIFKLDANFEKLSEAFHLFDGPLLFKQGTLEGIELQENKLYTVGDFSSVPRWQEGDDKSWIKIEAMALPAEIAGIELSGITGTPNGFLGTSEDNVTIFNLSNGNKHELKISPFLKKNADIQKLIFGGIAYDKNRLFILSENYSSIIVANASNFEVDYVFGIEPCDAADLSYHQGKIYVVVDHNYNEARPPVYVYDIEEAIKASINTKPYEL